VLEVVRREAIGAGGSSLVRGCSVVHLLVGRAAAAGSAHVPPLCVRSRRRTMHSVQATSLFLEECSDEKVAHIVQVLVQEGISVFRVEEEKRSLEDIFLQMTMGEQGI